MDLADKPAEKAAVVFEDPSAPVGSPPGFHWGPKIREFHKCYTDHQGNVTGICTRNYALSPILCLRSPAECNWCHHSSHFLKREAPKTRRGGKGR